MIAALRSRNSWVAVVFILLVSPFYGFCYLNRGTVALIYFFGTIILATVTFEILGLHFPSATLSNQLSLISWPIAVIGSVHGYFVAQSRDRSETLRWYARWLAIIPLLCLVIPLVGLSVVRAYLYRPFDAPTNSMSPTINKGDYFIISERAYDQHSPTYGDVIVFNSPSLSASYVKRIVGLPGDRVQMSGGMPYVNGMAFRAQQVGQTNAFVEVSENGVSYTVLNQIENGPLDDTEEYTVPPNKYFVLGDNRDNSTDSRREIGFVDRSDILGRVTLRWWNGTRHWFDLTEIR
jgi:signal peptidase I